MSPTNPAPAARLAALFPGHLAVLASRAAAALEASGFDALLVHSGTPREIFEDDRHHPFEVHAPFKVWVPLEDAPDSFVFFQPGRRPRLLFNEPRDFWHAPARLPDNWWTAHFDISRFASAGELAGLVPAAGRIAYIGDARAVLGQVELAALNPRALMRRLDHARAVKTPYEAECLRAASASGAWAHRAAEQAFHAGASEFEIELAFLAACRAREQDLPYNPIIALNEHAATLHYQHLERGTPGERRSFLIDAGTEFAGYASDITRTYAGAVAGAAGFAALVGGLDELQQRLCAGLKPGRDWRDVHLEAHALTAELLAAHGLLRCTPAEALERQVTHVFFPHGIGHLLGLEVHDVGGRLASPEGGEIPPPEGHTLRLTRTLEPGFVVTVEPGVYFIDSLLAAAQGDGRGALIDWPRVDALRPFGGIRIEDDVMITATGCENFTRAAFAAEA